MTDPSQEAVELAKELAKAAWHTIGAMGSQEDIEAQRAAIFLPLVDSVLRAVEKRTALAAWERGWADCEKYHVDDGPEGPDYEEYRDAAISSLSLPREALLCKVCTTAESGLPTPGYVHDPWCASKAPKPHVCTYQCADTDCENVVGPAPKPPSEEEGAYNAQLEQHIRDGSWERPVPAPEKESK